MQNWQLAVVVLLAVLVGAALPVLMQLWITLRTARSVLATGGQRLDRALEEVTGTATRISQIADSLQALSEKIRIASAIGAAVGPAVAAAVRAFRAPADDATNGKGDNHD
jgi:hypothetical protein